MSDLPQQAFVFGYFPAGTPAMGVGIRGLATTQFQNYSNVPNQVAPGFYGLTLVFDAVPTPIIPLLYVTVTETNSILTGVGPTGRRAFEKFAQGQIVIGKVEDGSDFYDPD